MCGDLVKMGSVDPEESLKAPRPVSGMCITLVTIYKTVSIFSGSQEVQLNLRNLSPVSLTQPDPDRLRTVEEYGELRVSASYLLCTVRANSQTRCHLNSS